MTATGVGMCYFSALTACGPGALMAAHGANNMYENSANLWNGRTDTAGPLRKIYQGAALTAGGSERQGNIAYGTVDVGLSIHGLSRLVLKPGAWKLFTRIRPDYVRSYRLMNKGALFFEIGMGSWTTSNLIEEIKK